MIAEKAKDAYKRYTDPTGEFSNQSLAAATWYVTHKVILQRIGIIFLAIAAALFLGIGLWGWGSYLVVGRYDDERLARDHVATIQNYEVARQGQTAQNIAVSGVNVFVPSLDSYDLVANAQNPNKDWVAYISYAFTYDGGSTEPVETVLLPGESRPLALLGQRLSAYPLNARLVFTSIRWWRVDPHRIADVPGFIASRVAFTLDDFSFTRAQSGENTVPAHTIRFSLANTSVYSYWQPVFYVELINNGQTVGLLYVTTDRFRAGEKRDFDIRSFAPDLMVSEVRAYPIINPFDAAVYMEPGE